MSMKDAGNKFLVRMKRDERFSGARHRHVEV
jgi:hypothetical protein